MNRKIKRGNGTGTFYHQPNGQWRVRVTIDGKRVSFTSKRKKDCQNWLKQKIEYSASPKPDVKNSLIGDGLRNEMGDLMNTCDIYEITVQETDDKNEVQNTFVEYFAVKDFEDLPATFSEYQKQYPRSIFEIVQIKHLTLTNSLSPICILSGRLIEREKPKNNGMRLENIPTSIKRDSPIRYYSGLIKEKISELCVSRRILNALYRDLLVRENASELPTDDSKIFRIVNGPFVSFEEWASYYIKNPDELYSYRNIGQKSKDELLSSLKEYLKS